MGAVPCCIVEGMAGGENTDRSETTSSQTSNVSSGMFLGQVLFLSVSFKVNVKMLG